MGDPARGEHPETAAARGCCARQGKKRLATTIWGGEKSVVCEVESKRTYVWGDACLVLRGAEKSNG